MTDSTPQSADDLQFHVMSPERRQSYLAQPHVAVVSIPAEGRGPLCAPVWYWYEGDANPKTLWWITPRESRKGRLLAVGTPLTFSVMDGELSGRYASVEGVVTKLETPAIEDHQIPLAQRYLGPELGTAYGLRLSEENGESYLIHVRLRRWLTGELLPPNGG